MKTVQRILAFLLAVTALPFAAAEEPEEAQAVWEDVVGPGTAQVTVEPRHPAAGEQFVATLTLDTDLAIAGITYQMCDVGSTCFAIGYPVPEEGNGTFVLRTADEWMHSEFMDDGELRTFRAGERIGWQYFIELDDGNGTVLSFPHGDECDVFAPDDEWLACQETHYFAVDIAEGKSTPAPLLFPMLAVLLLAGRRRA